MNSLTEHIVGEITSYGADLVGVGSLLELPEDVVGSVEEKLQSALPHKNEGSMQSQQHTIEWRKSDG